MRDTTKASTVGYSRSGIWLPADAIWCSVQALCICRTATASICQLRDSPSLGMSPLLSSCSSQRTCYYQQRASHVVHKVNGTVLPECLLCGKPSSGQVLPLCLQTAAAATLWYDTSIGQFCANTVPRHLLLQNFCIGNECTKLNPSTGLVITAGHLVFGTGLGRLKSHSPVVCTACCLHLGLNGCTAMLHAMSCCLQSHVTSSATHICLWVCSRVDGHVVLCELHDCSAANAARLHMEQYNRLQCIIECSHHLMPMLPNLKFGGHLLCITAASCSQR